MPLRETVAAGEATNGDVPVWTRPRGVGRPSTVAQYAQRIAEWLRDEPAVSGAEVLRRVRLVGYRGGKSALYELVRRLRHASSANN